jgi:hypothetical protein
MDEVMTAFMRIVGILLTGVLVTACTGTKISDSWSSLDYKGQVKNVYLIGIVIDDLNRMIFENTLKIRLAEEGIQSTPSHYDFSKSFEDEEETIRQKIRGFGCDSILMTRVVDNRTNASFSSGHQSFYYLPRRAMSSDVDFDRFPTDSIRIYNYIKGYQTVPKMPTGVRFVTLSLESFMYNLQTGELIWSARIKTDFKGNPMEMMQEIVDEAVMNLKEKGLI